MKSVLPGAGPVSSLRFPIYSRSSLWFGLPPPPALIFTILIFTKATAISQHGRTFSSLKGKGLQAPCKSANALTQGTLQTEAWVWLQVLGF